MTNAINKSFDKGILSVSFRQCVITCLPKKGKPRKHIKNWRPLSMLSVIYKLASAAIANRIKPHLNEIIDKTQCGFVPGRYIGESTRLVYDIMKFTEDATIPGMLVLIDFEKAFDSISWSFIYKTLQYLGFTEAFIKWIKLFNRDIKATVAQCGELSKFFNIERGCRQGDPISAYIFIMAAQILTILIKFNKDIKGIKIGNTEFKLVQFADDTTLILNGTVESLQAALNILEIFGSFSGLKINTDKTQIVWIGKKKHSKDKVNIQNISWNTINKFRLLGINSSTELDNCIDLNFSEKMLEIKGIINKWNKRYLTPLGKVTVIKTFIMSGLNHLLLTLPNPNETFIKELNNILFKFLWSGKPDKINRNTVTLDKHLGGLKMVNMKDFITSLKVSWIRRLVLSEKETPWILLFQKALSIDHSKLISLGPQYQIWMKKRTKNKFWHDVFDAWYQFSKRQDFYSNTDLLTSPLWYNEKLTCKDMFLPKWFEKGIITIADVIEDSGVLMKLDDIKRKYSIDHINPLHYLRVQKNVKCFIQKYKLSEIYMVERPFVPFQLKYIWANKKGVSAYYKIINQLNENIHIMKYKWQRELQVSFDEQLWKNIFSICYKSVCNNSLIWFQLKVLYRILGTKSYLHKMAIEENAKCNHCQKMETIVHMFVECDNVKKFWNVIEKFIHQTVKLKLTFHCFDILFGYLLPGEDKVPINALILVTKKYIFDTNHKNGILNFDLLRQKLQQTL